MHHKITSQSFGSEVVHATRAVSDISHDHCLRICKTAQKKKSMMKVTTSRFDDRNVKPEASFTLASTFACAPAFRLKMLTPCLWGCCINVENGHRTYSLHPRQIVYGNTMLQFDANANVDASVNEALQIHSFDYSRKPDILSKTLNNYQIMPIIS